MNKYITFYAVNLVDVKGQIIALFGLDKTKADIINIKALQRGEFNFASGWGESYHAIVRMRRGKLFCEIGKNF